MKKGWLKMPTKEIKLMVVIPDDSLESGYMRIGYLWFKEGALYSFDATKIEPEWILGSGWERVKYALASECNYIHQSPFKNKNGRELWDGDKVRMWERTGRVKFTDLGIWTILWDDGGCVNLWLYAPSIEYTGSIYRKESSDEKNS